MAVEWNRIAYDSEVLNKEFTIEYKEENYSMTTDDFGKCFEFTSCLGDATFTLPNASSIWAYKRIRISYFGPFGDTLTVEPYSGGTINGKAKLETNQSGAWVELILTGSNTWQIYSSSGEDTGLNYGGWLLLTSSGYQFSKTITIDHNKVSGSSNHSNFPVLIKELNQNYLKTRANGGTITNTNGYDIIFTSDSGGETQLDHEIQRYSGVDGDLIAWVRIPTLLYSSNTTIYMHYCNSGISTSQENVSGTWDTHFKGVWHLKEQGDGSLNEYVDSSGNSNHGQGGAGTSGYVPEKYKNIIDYGQLYDGQNDQIDCKSGSTLDQLSSLTISAWIKPTSFEDILPRIFEKRAAAGQSKLLYLDHTTNTLVYQQITDGTNLERSSDPGVIFLNGWYHIAYSWDGTLNASGLNCYINGELSNGGSQSGTGTAVDDSGGNFWLFCRDTNDRTFLGIVGEVHISETVRSADWIKTEYNNQVDPKSFYSVT